MAIVTYPGGLCRAVTADLLHRLREAGYVPRVTDFLARSTIQADADLCREAICGACGHVRLNYHPFHRGPRLRVVGICPAPGCGAAEEF